MTFSFQEYYKKAIQNNEVVFDASQVVVVSAFDNLFSEIKKDYKFSFFENIKKKIFRSKITNRIKKGLYLYGSVGRGKTFLMDMFYELVPLKKKIRIHLHHFLLEAQKEISGTNEDRLISIEDYAENFCKEYDLLCLDEFYVDHIGDAMFLKRLFDQFFNYGLFVVLTSNTKPKNLYKNGISRELFEPFILEVESYMNIISLDGNDDYRIKKNNIRKKNRYYIGNNKKSKENFSFLFFLETNSKQKKHNFKIGTYSYEAMGISKKSIWFSFSELCEKPRGKKDYIELAKKFNIWFLSDIPHLLPNKYNEAKRLVTLIDVLYDYGVKLWIEAKTIPSLIYPKGRDLRSFKRTISRLIHMTHGKNEINKKI